MARRVGGWRKTVRMENAIWTHACIYDRLDASQM